MEEFSHQLHTAQLAAEAADIIIREYRSEGKTFEKKIKTSETDFATTADLECEAIIANLIQAEFPDDTIISEETAANGQLTEHTWIVDPIDGTFNFANGKPWCGPMIARTVGDELELGVVHSPMESEVMWGVRGQGAYLNDERVHVDTITPAAFGEDQIHFGWTPTPEKVTIDTLLSPTLFEDGKVLQRLVNNAGTRFPGAGSAVGMLHNLLVGKLSMVISGGFIWDIAPTAAILLEAGFNITDLRGNPIKWKNGAQVVVTSHPTHTEQLMNYINA